ncbi:hypothetical protein IAT38_003110 [Cryptococcus sp. DSM 104549]
MSEAVTDDKWNDESADVVFISADNVKFYVPSYHLLSHSVVLRDALLMNATLPTSSNTPRSPITFTDPLAESAASVRLFLGFASGFFGDQLSRPYLEEGGRYGDEWAVELEPHVVIDAEDRAGSMGSESIVRDLHGVLTFCEKWNCPAVLGVLTLWLERFAARDAYRSIFLQPLDIFILAAKTGLDSVATAVVKYYRPGLYHLWERALPFSFAHLAGRKGLPFELGVFPKAVWDEVPGMYLYALARANEEKKSQYDRGERFGLIMRKYRFGRVNDGQ